MHQLRFLKCPHDVTMSRSTLFFSKRGHNSINAHKIFDNMTVDEPFNFCMTLLHTKPYGLVLSSLLNGHVYIFTLKKKNMYCTEYVFHLVSFDSCKGPDAAVH